MSIKLILNEDSNHGLKPVKIYTRDIQAKAISQLKNLSALPFVHSHIAAMPDVHVGIGATVGAVIPCDKAIIPAAVGVDIGCGMNAIRLSIKAYQLPDNLRAVRQAIEAAVPVGKAAHRQAAINAEALAPLESQLMGIFEKHPTLTRMLKRPILTVAQQLGTLGNGNHFIELCIDENQDVWIMLHSGSRGIGNAIGRYFIQNAKREMERHQVQLPDRDLAYFSEGNPGFDDYLEALEWAQAYAWANRTDMMRRVIVALKAVLPHFEITQEAINCHHNYVAREVHFGKSVYVTRKGAIRAGEGELGIIPGSMGAASFIVRGKGNPESFCSCAHGAGRRLSRTAARAKFKRRDLMAQTRGVECRVDSAVIDEIPAAYKPIDEVMENQKDLVDIVHRLKQVVCVKG